MAEQKINPILKQVLEFGPTIIFFIVYLRIKDETYSFQGVDYSGFIVAALLLIPLLLGAMGVLWYLTKKISRMQVFTAFMVIFFGGLTAWFNDETFFKMKTTIVYGFFAAILGFGLLRGRSFLEYVMGEFLPMEMEGWMIFTRRIVWMFLGMAVANEVIWRTQSEATWVTLETFAFPVALIVFMWSQIYVLQHFLIEEEPEP
ncbi:MAG: intracellular septation protein [Paracoccaceae bacterium]|jgi:intracellular septation protein